jgi:PII-like signaling protein
MILARGEMGMSVPTEAVLLRIFVGEEDQYGGHALFKSLVTKALEMKMAGATVLPGPEGFGRSRYVRSELNVDAGPRLPMVVEIVDREENINRFIPVLHEMVESGLVTLEKVRAIYYRRRGSEPEISVLPPPTAA